jgi:hypothetical protein
VPVVLGPVALAAQRTQILMPTATVILIKCHLSSPPGKQGRPSETAGNSYATVWSVVPENVSHIVRRGSPDVVAH